MTSELEQLRQEAEQLKNQIRVSGTLPIIAIIAPFNLHS